MAYNNPPQTNKTEKNLNQIKKTEVSDFIFLFILIALFFHFYSSEKG